MKNRKVIIAFLAVLVVAVVLFLTGAALILMDPKDYMLQAGLVVLTVSEFIILGILKFIEKKYEKHLYEEQKTDIYTYKWFLAETFGGSLISLLLYCLLAFYVSFKNPAMISQRLILIGFLILLVLFILGDVVRWVRYIRHYSAQKTR